jgi:hypothetical protein
MSCFKKLTLVSNRSVCGQGYKNIKTKSKFGGAKCRHTDRVSKSDLTTTFTLHSVTTSSVVPSCSSNCCRNHIYMLGFLELQNVMFCRLLVSLILCSYSDVKILELYNYHTYRAVCCDKAVVVGVTVTVLTV